MTKDEREARKVLQRYYDYHHMTHVEYVGKHGEAVLPPPSEINPALQVLNIVSATD